MPWEDQGRQEHGWFGHGTSPKDDGDAAVAGKSLPDRSFSVAYGALAASPRSVRGRLETQYHGGTLARFKAAMTAWMGSTRLDRARFASLFLDSTPDDPVVQALHRAALVAGLATSHIEMRDASENVAKAIDLVGIDCWPRFIAQAQARAEDPATRLAVEKSQVLVDPNRSDAIRPVYPLETLLGIGSAGLVGGWGAAARSGAGAALRQVLPDGRPASAPPPTPDTALPETAPTRTSGEEFAKPLNLRIHLDKQAKHVRGTKNYIPGRSELTADPHELLRQFAGRGKQKGNITVGEPGSKEVFDAGQIIGIFRDGPIEAPTSRGMIHYATKDAHIVPANPEGY